VNGFPEIVGAEMGVSEVSDHDYCSGRIQDEFQRAFLTESVRSTFS